LDSRCWIGPILSDTFAPTKMAIQGRGDQLVEVVQFSLHQQARHGG
jgi:hypothetical protein